ncbi:MAG: aldose 1-epimerase family protein [Pseudolabrys sp.]|nr:aldose 1-epimerase family protein [Pseudolabrys sp.]
MSPDDAIILRSGDATARVALHGAELTSWTVGGREVMWSADPQYWARSAPILFPVVGASRDGAVSIAGKTFAMPQHGFARDSVFDVVERSDDAVTLRLIDNGLARMHYPFSFALAVTVKLAGDELTIEFSVENTGGSTMPYQLGWHPAFVWPFLSHHKAGHEVLFASDKPRAIVRPNAYGLLKRSSVSAEARLVLDDQMFEQGALVFADAGSDAVTFTSPSGASLNIAVEDFPHWAIWTKLGAPFVSIEQWTGLPEWEDEPRPLKERPSAILLEQGDRRRHSIRLSVTTA